METNVAYLFLTIDNVKNSKIWQDYFPPNTPIYVHAKYPQKVKGFFKKYLIKLGMHQKKVQRHSEALRRRDGGS